MKLATSRPKPSLSPPRAFADILRPEINVVSVPRPIDPALQLRLVNVAQQTWFDHEATLDVVDTDPSPLLVGIEDERVRSFLAEDIGHLARQLGAILGRKHVHARLYVKRTDGCRKIHADNVTIRLLCTYAGPGTDWLPNEDVVRAFLGANNPNIEQANRRVIRKGAVLRRCELGEVLLLKGGAYPGNETFGAAHRAPPLGRSGVSRLVLRIDENPCGC